MKKFIIIFIGISLLSNSVEVVARPTRATSLAQIQTMIASLRAKLAQLDVQIKMISPVTDEQKEKIEQLKDERGETAQEIADLQQQATELAAIQAAK